MNNLEELKNAALAANFHGWTGIEDEMNADGHSRLISRFVQHCHPSVVLGLIAQLEATQKERDALREVHIGAGSNTRAAADIYFQLVEELQVPAGYCIMPKSLTAENGAKGALSGEFFTETDIKCEECGGDCDEDDPCEHCNDLGVQTVRAAIGWSTIKDIYKMAVGATAIRPVGLSVEGNADAE